MVLKLKVGFKALLKAGLKSLLKVGFEALLNVAFKAYRAYSPLFVLVCFFSFLFFPAFRLLRIWCFLSCQSSGFDFWYSPRTDPHNVHSLKFAVVVSGFGSIPWVECQVLVSCFSSMRP